MIRLLILRTYTRDSEGWRMPIVIQGTLGKLKKSILGLLPNKYPLLFFVWLVFFNYLKLSCLLMGRGRGGRGDIRGTGIAENVGSKTETALQHDWQG